MNMNELRSLAKERNLRGYSRLRKADLINVLRENELIEQHIEQSIEQPLSDALSGALTKRQLKRRRNKASKLSKTLKKLRIEIDDLKSQKDNVEDQISEASSSTSARFKRMKIRSMKREATKIAEKIREATKTAERIREQLAKLEELESKQPMQPKPNKRIKRKIEDLNRKIRRVKGGGKTKRNLIAKRDALKLQLFDLTPKLIEGAFGGAYGKYRIDGVEGMDLPTFFSKPKNSILNILKKESTRRTIRSQTVTWIRFMKNNE